MLQTDMEVAFIRDACITVGCRYSPVKCHLDTDFPLKLCITVVYKHSNAHIYVKIIAITHKIGISILDAYFHII